MMINKCAFTGLWKTIQGRVQTTWFWRLFGVCAMQRLWTKFLVAVAIGAGFWGISLGVELLNPILPLEELERTEGVLVRVYVPLKTVHGSTVTIRTDEGRVIKFRGSMQQVEKKGFINKSALEQVVGQRIIVWHQDYFRLWPPFYYNRFWEVRHVKGDVHISYEGFWKGRNKFKPSDIRWLKRLLALTAACIAIVILACFRDAAKLHKQE
jgi:hypothetical protein